jgi:RES domain-containing protein
MVVTRNVRDSKLIDALEEADAEPFEGSIWRVVREGKDPCLCASPGGRWDDRTFDVLYTATERDGAIAEMNFHLLRGQPVIPSKVRYKIFELAISLSRLLTLPTLDHLSKLGLDASKFGQLSYDDREHEYPRTQDIAETAHFLGYDGVLVPSARWNSANIIVFCDRLPAGALHVVHDHGLIDWPSWRREHPVSDRFKPTRSINA